MKLSRLIEGTTKSKGKIRNPGNTATRDPKWETDSYFAIFETNTLLNEVES
jgi:hypothetical protein